MQSRRRKHRPLNFTGYIDAKSGAWAWHVIDLATLELAAEGEKAYAAAGKPNRIQQFTQLQLVTNEKNAAANVAIDDIGFYKELPEHLASGE